MNYRFYITALSSRVEVFPMNFRQCALVDERRSISQIRTIFNNTLRFTDNNRGDDFSLFYLIEATTPCERLILEIEEKDSGADTYHEWWTGYFSTTDGRFDLDNCTFDITPKPLDDYYEIDIYGNDKRNILHAGLSEMTTLTHDEDYTHNYFIIDVIEYLIDEIYPGATVVSWFLNNENNPVVGGINKYRYLTIAQKSDIKRPNATNPATIGMLSFNEMMEILKMFNLWWSFADGVLRIEHYDFWESSEGIDLRSQAMAVKANKYSYLKEDMPKYEKFEFMEANDGNFVAHEISYNSPCVAVDVTEEYRTNVTTDLSYIIKCMADPDLAGNISDDGWVILANYYDGVDYRVYYGVSYDSPIATYNYPNSWAHLLRSFFLHGRVLLSGYIQYTAYDFISVRKTKQQNINAIICYEDNYRPEDYITTELGEDWFGGQKGYVKTARRHPDGKVEFTLLYGEDKNTDVELPPVLKTIHCIIDPVADVVSTFLSEPSLVDMSYWIYYNPTGTQVCQEIEILAGTTYQEDAAAETGAITNVEFYLTEVYADGWNFIYNDNEEVALSTSPPCPAVPPVPPAVPAATTMIGCGQAIVCDKITINWRASAGTTFYKLYRKPDTDLIDQWEEVDNVLATTYEDYWAGAQGGITFYYKVKCCNASGCSADSDETSIIATC